MVEICSKPLLDWQIQWLAREGVERAIFALGYSNEHIVNYFGEKWKTDYGELEIEYSIEKEKLGSGGAIKLASGFVKEDNVLIVNGDILTNLKLDPLIEAHFSKDSEATMQLTMLRSPYGIVEIEEGQILSFKEKPLLNIQIHAGIDIVKRKILSEFPDKGQMEDTIFPEVVERGLFGAVKMDKKYFWNSIDSPKDYLEANKEWKGLD